MVLAVILSESQSKERNGLVSMRLEGRQPTDTRVLLVAYAEFVRGSTSEHVEKRELP